MNLLKIFSMMIALMTIMATLTGCSDCEEVAALEGADYIGFIGDSIFHVNGENCKDVGSQLSLLRGEYIENLSVNGAELSGGSVKSVEEQFDELMDAGGDEVEIIIAIGGGNTILYNIGVCVLFGCPDIVDDIFADGYRLVDKMRSQGIEKILYVGYDVIQPTEPFLGPILNSMMDRMAEEHGEGGMDIEFLDMRGIYQFGDARLDGYHPTVSGSRKYAEAIYDKLDELGW